MSEDMSSPEDIARARHLKELEPLHEAWSSWAYTRQVRNVSCPCRVPWLNATTVVLGRNPASHARSRPNHARPGIRRIHLTH
jgi:hypothetical protein